MPPVYSSTVKNNRLQQVLEAIDSLVIAPGTGSPSAGQLVIGTSALSGGTGVLATIPLSNPAGIISAGVLTLSGVPLSATASASGTAAKAEIRNNAGTTIVSGLTVGTSASDINLNSTTVTVSQTVTVTAATITHP